MAPFVYQCQPYPSYTYTALPSPPLSYPSKLSHLINLSSSSVSSHFKERLNVNTVDLPLLPPMRPPPSPSHNSIISPDINSYSPPSSSTAPSAPYDLPLPSRQQSRSIQSLLNSPPELKRLDEEEYKCGYRSHFINPGVKRKRPSNPHSTSETSTKKSKSCSKHDTEEYNAFSFYTSTIASSSSTAAIKGGLRHFSKQVCDKVKAHGITTYDQVVHEIICDLASSSASPWFDQKNIRRRVYDALNVLMAMDIIAKVKKEIKWLGIPSCYQPYAMREIDNDGNMDILLRTDDSFLVQQIRAEEARKKALLSSLSASRSDIQKSLRKYLQLRRLIRRNQRAPSYVPATTLPLITTSGDEDCTSDILSHLFNYPFTAQELTAWLPDSSWYHYIDLNAS